jgi:hypothetical protein
MRESVPPHPLPRSAADTSWDLAGSPTTRSGTQASRRSRARTDDPASSPREVLNDEADVPPSVSIADTWSRSLFLRRDRRGFRGGYRALHRSVERRFRTNTGFTRRRAQVDVLGEMLITLRSISVLRRTIAGTSGFGERPQTNELRAVRALELRLPALLVRATIAAKTWTRLGGERPRPDTDRTGLAPPAI